jgi:hypothetical protein
MILSRNRARILPDLGARGITPRWTAGPAETCGKTIAPDTGTMLSSSLGNQLS